MRLHGGERNNSRPPPYASISRLRSVKGGPLRQASPALDPATALPRGEAPLDPADDSRPSHFMKGLDNFLLIEGGGQANGLAFVFLAADFRACSSVPCA